MDQATRNKLRGVVTHCRRLLEEAVSQELQGKFGVYAAKKDEVQVDDEARMSHLTDEERAARKDILDHFTHIKARGFRPKEALEQLVREIAYTHLNRLCAYKMMEARQVYVSDQRFREAVSRGVNSNGVKFYLADHPDDERLYTTGKQDRAYQHFLDWLGGLLSEEIGILFSPHDPANRLYPPQRVLDEVLALVNDEALADIWGQDETIGWIYQYFTPKELRDQTRKESAAPRNSYELAFRNQFFTPRYVVEFLTDNTLGRVWYEMRKGDTKLKDQCRYMVRRPSEVFMTGGQEPPKEDAEGRDGLPQEELLKLPVYVRHRPKKDPRELKILDPACGSGHFLLYCFDLLLTIYEEAYADTEIGPALQRAYPTLESLRRDLPRLILAHNLHGIDIDLRATQIAALALWLRCQRAYQDMGLKKDRPTITRSNFVCAEPMPGEQSMLKEFVGQLEPKLLGQLVEAVFDKMKLAGEAGSLLKIEEEIRDAVAAARRQWLAGPVSIQRSLFGDDEPVTRQPRFDFSGITDSQFFEQAETKVVEALRSYAEKAQNGQQLQRRLFTEDAVRGFAFVEICHKRFDVVLMNPPFGSSSKLAKATLDRQYPRTKNDLLAAFVERGLARLFPSGLLGAITSRTAFFLSSFEKWREEILLDDYRPTVFADLGNGVLDTAMVETAAYCVLAGHGEGYMPFFRLVEQDDKAASLCSAVSSLRSGVLGEVCRVVNPASFSAIPGSPFAYWVDENIRKLFKSNPRVRADGRDARFGASTKGDARFVRAWWEIPAKASGRSRKETQRGKRWVPFVKGGAYSPFYSDIEVVLDWDNDGHELKEYISEYRGTRGWGYNWTAALNGYTEYFRPGLVWSRRSQKGFSTRILPSGCIFGEKGPAILVSGDNKDALYWMLAIFNSSLFTYLLHLKTSFGSYEVGAVENMPLPIQSLKERKPLIELAKEAALARQREDVHNEVKHLFVAPVFVLGEAGASPVNVVVESNWTQLLPKLNAEVCAAYGVDMPLMQLGSAFTEEDSSGGHDDNDVEDEDGNEPVLGMDSRRRSDELVSYCVGVAMGRWDVRFATREFSFPNVPDPFDSLPVCPPGMIQSASDARGEANVGSYPPWCATDGILLDDREHKNDVVTRVRGVLEIIWKDRADSIEKEGCEALGVRELRDYVRKPSKGGFWDDHVSRYSKSRRKAPIYWLLQSSNRNYALWLYYHRLDKDLLFKALLNYVEPKIRLEDSRLDALRTQMSAAGSSGREAKRLSKEVERQEEFLSELGDFEDKLRRVANLHLVPDLNDGVILNIAPLWELVPWKEAEKVWGELLKGKYEWSSIGKQLRQKELVK